MPLNPDIFSGAEYVVFDHPIIIIIIIIISIKPLNFCKIFRNCGNDINDFNNGSKIIIIIIIIIIITLQKINILKHYIHYFFNK